MDEQQFLQMLTTVRNKRDEFLRTKYRRSLPFGDAMTDRWERAQQLGFGEKASIYDSALVYGDVRVGANSWIGPYTLLDGSQGPLTIGAFCSISAGSYIYTHDTALWALSGGQKEKRGGSVVIGDCVYIGSQCLVLPDVHIENRTLIAANSLVNRDVLSGQIVGGIPARPIGRVEGEGGNVKLVYFSHTGAI